MARTRVNRDIAKEAIHSLLHRASESGGKRFVVGNKYTVIPKVVVAEGGLLLVFSKSLLEFVDLNNLESVIIDVLGLCEDKVTQLEIYSEGTVVYSPGKNRDERKIQEFVKLLAYESR